MAGCLDQTRLTGVNLSGAEFNSAKLPGTVYKDYTYPTDAEMTFIAAQGANVIRFPFRWERVQRAPMAALDAGELKRMKATVSKANSLGLCVILDAHNYAKYGAKTFKDDPTLKDALVDFWVRMSVEFNDPSGVAFGLMNEPSNMLLADWAALAKRTVAELRKVGNSNLLFVAGGKWSGVHDWFSLQNGVSNATAFADLRDPLNRVVLEAHQYTDADYSGTGTTCRPADEFNDKFTKLAAWATTNQQQLFLGEFGVPATAECLKTLDRFLTLMVNSPWKGWTYWSAGGWWGKYPMAVNTSATAPSQQWAIMKRYFFSSTKKSPPKPPEPR
jgi:endoglucanase